MLMAKFSPGIIRYTSSINCSKIIEYLGPGLSVWAGPAAEVA